MFFRRPSIVVEQAMNCEDTRVEPEQVTEKYIDLFKVHLKTVNCMELKKFLIGFLIKNWSDRFRVQREK